MEGRNEGWVIVTLVFNRISFTVAMGPIKTVTWAPFEKCEAGKLKEMRQGKNEQLSFKPWKMTNQIV